MFFFFLKNPGKNKGITKTPRLLKIIKYKHPERDLRSFERTISGWLEINGSCSFYSSVRYVVRSRALSQLATFFSFFSEKIFLHLHFSVLYVIKAEGMF